MSTVAVSVELMTPPPPNLNVALQGGGCVRDRLGGEAMRAQEVLRPINIEIGGGEGRAP